MPSGLQRGKLVPLRIIVSFHFVALVISGYLSSGLTAIRSEKAQVTRSYVDFIQEDMLCN